MDIGQSQGAAAGVNEQAPNAQPSPPAGGAASSKVQQPELHQAAGLLREKLPITKVSSLADKVVRRLENAAVYVQGSSLQHVKDDARDLVRRYPWQSLAIGLTAGLVFGRLTSRRSMG